MENYNESISAVFHYSYIELFRGNKTIQWQPACPAWLSAPTEGELDIYLLITVQWLSLLTKALRWDISAVSSCSFEKRFVNCHFELNIQRILTTTWHLRQITSPVFTHPVVSEPCPLCSEAIHFYSSCTKWKPTCFESMICWPFSASLDIVKTGNFDISCCKKRWSPAGLRYLGSAVALIHFSSHWLPGDRESRGPVYAPGGGGGHSFSEGDR